VATRLTYTTGTRCPELDRDFESAREAVRERTAEPQPHVIGGREVPSGATFAREDPST